MCDPFYFDGITTEAFLKVKEDLGTAGFALDGPTGIVNGPYGIVIQYDWTEQSQSLKIIVLEKSFFLSCDMIKEKIAHALGKYALKVG